MSTDVIVVGAGAVGLAVALRLAESGSTVTVVDADEPGRKASWAASGSLSLILPQAAPRPLRELAAASWDRWPDFSAQLEQRSGMEVQLRRSGLVRLMLSEASTTATVESREWLAAHGHRSEWIDRDGIAELTPAATDRVDRALYQPDVWQLRPPRLMRALLEAAARTERITVAPFSPVAHLLVEGPRVRGVRLTTGADLFAQEVVVCAGAWADRLLNPIAGITMAIRPIRGQLLCLTRPSDLRPGSDAILLGEGNHYLIPRSDGRLVAGSTFEDSGFDDRVTAGGLHEILSGALDFAPKITEAPIVAHWAGLRPSTPDGAPLLGRPQDVDGLVVAAGHFRDGLLLTPVTADIVHAVINGTQPPLDLTAYAVGRPSPVAGDSPGPHTVTASDEYSVRPSVSTSATS
ncbi:glycine oxidase ThiO [Nocardia sp. NPDC019395]|uniref:glycine oxidase ThiO n=1 Tax=Nocardia sp. NPDC019395 TaxID=3154686 RepID=UPI0033F14306